MLTLINNIINNTDCPWAGFRTSEMHFCEEELCAWITQPANTWSNLAYIFVGIYIIYLARKDKKPFLTTIGIIEIILGFGSFFFHASSTHIGAVLDVSAMYLFICFTLTINLNRWLDMKDKAISKAYQLTLFCILSILSIMVVAIFNDEIGIYLFAFLAIASGHFEAEIFRKQRDKHNYKPLLMLLIFFGVAWGIWWLDVTKTICDPTNHFIQGHAFWHLLNSFCFYFLYKFYKQINIINTYARDAYSL